MRYPTVIWKRNKFTSYLDISFIIQSGLVASTSGLGGHLRMLGAAKLDVQMV